MIAARNPQDHDSPVRETVGGVNAVRRSDGSLVRLDDIATAEEGRALLEEVDAGILAIEEQIENWTEQRHDPDWPRRAKTALKRKRRIRPALQQRIAELRRSEKLPATPTLRVGPKAELIERRRVAFINAAEAVLDRELFVEIWARAAEDMPEVFEGVEGKAR